MTNVEVRSIIARVEDMTTANFNMLLEDETFCIDGRRDIVHCEKMKHVVLLEDDTLSIMRK